MHTERSIQPSSREVLAEDSEVLEVLESNETAFQVLEQGKRQASVNDEAMCDRNLCHESWNTSLLVIRRGFSAVSPP